MRITKICIRCGKEFKVKPSIAKIGKGKYCSFDCRFPEKSQIKNCLNCKKKFKAIPSLINKGGGKFCSHKCQGRFYMKGEFRICRACNKKFYLKASKKRQGGGIFCSNSCKFNYHKGERSPNWKGGKEKRICQQCNRSFELYLSTFHAGKFCSKRCEMLFKKGENHPNWRGGISKAPYLFDFDEELKELIRKRNNYICQVCGEDQSNLIGYHKKPPVHHIDYDKSNNDPKNLITLCKECHHKTGHNRENWIQYFSYQTEHIAQTNLN